MIEISHLINARRISSSESFDAFKIFYLPLGLLILCLRLLLVACSSVFGLLAPNSRQFQQVRAELMCRALGVYVRLEKPSETKCKVLVSNCLTILDDFVLFCALGSTSLKRPRFPLLTKICGLDYLAVRQDNPGPQVQDFVQNRGGRLLLQPEGQPTNGRGLLAFEPSVFDAVGDVQPIAVRVERPLYNVSSLANAGFWSELFWFLFSPYTMYTLSVLPKLPRSGRTDQEFANEAQKVIAGKLGVEATSHTKADVAEWCKRYSSERGVLRIKSEVQITAEMKRMAKQVKEVLPAVPFHIILGDLARTRNVNLTISNILEMHLPASQPDEAMPSTSASSPAAFEQSVQPSEACSSRKTSNVATFPKSAHERMKSFQEKKREMIEQARRKYVEKHGLSFVAFNQS